MCRLVQVRHTVLTLSATDAKRSTELASGAVCGGKSGRRGSQQRRPGCMRVLDALLSWLELWEVFCGEGGSLAGVPVEQGDGGCQPQAED